jgi:Rrf2 family nitric oxide-sensitive transcriptional repressor
MHLLMKGVLTQAAMRLTRYTDYAIRVLIYLGSRPDESASIRDVSQAFSISQNHLMKVVQDLAAAKFLATARGRNGGIRLARRAEEINLGELVRHTEELNDLLDCDSCFIVRACGLPSVLSEATAAFVKVFDKYTVADLVARRDDLRALLGERVSVAQRPTAS